MLGGASSAMAATPLLAQLPPCVLGVVRQLEEDPDSLEVWLIGSRACNTEHAGSDWDLLLMSKSEPEPVSRRHEGIDVLHCGPSGTVLLEGQPRAMAVQFESFSWAPVSPVEAEYSGIRFLPLQEGVVFEYSEPSVLRVSAGGFLLWRRAGTEA
jgi:hypothetical protein